jgi:hypothetical protein
MTAVTITNAGLNLLRDAMLGAATDTTVHYVAIGTGTSTPTATQTQLDTEVFRKAVTSYSNGGSDGEGIITMYLSPQDSVGTTIGEIGWFAGSSATSSSNSGVMIARALYSPTHTHTNQESIQFILDSLI